MYAIRAFLKSMDAMHPLTHPNDAPVYVSWLCLTQHYGSNSNSSTTFLRSSPEMTQWVHPPLRGVFIISSSLPNICISKIFGFNELWGLPPWTAFWDQSTPVVLMKFIVIWVKQKAKQATYRVTNVQWTPYSIKAKAFLFSWTFWV